MTHLETHPVVSIRVETDNGALLDDLESEFPATDDAAVGPEHVGPTRITEVDGLPENEERLVARVAYEIGEDAAAASLYDTIIGYDLSAASTYEVRHYKSPVGGVSADDVRQYYREHEAKQPTDEDGDPYVPSSWDPSNHVVDETSS